MTMVNPCPADGIAQGELQCRGPWVIDSYYNDEAATTAAFTDDGWFRTGDVATLAAESMLQITDRTKDLIKSGGEWISSIDLENEVMSHPAVAEAAAIAMPHPRWQERPMLIIVLNPDQTADSDEIRRHLEGRIATWWMPDDIVFVDDLPHTATGKVSKLQLRERFRDHVLLHCLICRQGASCPLNRPPGSNGSSSAWPRSWTSTSIPPRRSTRNR